jgi:hydrogenase maturation protease
MKEASVLVAGIGNIFLGDDAFGCVVANRLKEGSYPPEVNIIDFGIRGFDLSFALLRNYDFVILLDALAHSGPCGTLRVLDISASLANSTLPKSNTPEPHGMIPTRALELARNLGARFGQVLLIGCRPETLLPSETGDFTLSPSVAAAVDPAIKLVESMLAEFLGLRYKGGMNGVAHQTSNARARHHSRDY